MPTKVFIALIVLSSLVISFFVFYAMSWLGSIGDPRTAVEGFDYHSSIATPLIWGSTIMLLLIGNVILWTRQNAWALWVTFAYFAVLMIIDHFWLGRSLANFKAQNGLAGGGIEWGPLVGAIYVIGAGFVTVADHFLVVNLSRRLNSAGEDKATLENENGEEPDKVKGH